MRNVWYRLFFLTKLTAPQPILLAALFIVVCVHIVSPQSLAIAMLVVVTFYILTLWSSLNTKLIANDTNERISLLSGKLGLGFYKFLTLFVLTALLILLSLTVLSLRDAMAVSCFSLMLISALIAFEGMVSDVKILSFSLTLSTPFIFSFASSHSNNELYLFVYPAALTFILVGIKLIYSSHMRVAYD